MLNEFVICFDLDGTLAERWQAEWRDGVPEMLQYLTRQARVVIATNQGGVACGAAGWGEQYPSPTDIVTRFEALEADLPDGVEVEWRVSIYYPDAALGEQALRNIARKMEALGKQKGLKIRCYPEAAARKPGSAMLYGCDIFVGDHESDIHAARAASICVLSISLLREYRPMPSRIASIAVFVPR